MFKFFEIKELPEYVVISSVLLFVLLLGGFNNKKMSIKQMSGAFIIMLLTIYTINAIVNLIKWLFTG